MKLHDIEELAGIFTLFSFGVLMPLSALNGDLPWEMPWSVSISCGILSVCINFKIRRVKRVRHLVWEAGCAQRSAEYKSTAWEAGILLDTGERVTRMISGPKTAEGVRELLKHNCDRFGHTILYVTRPA